MMKFIAMLLVFVAGGGSVYLLTNFKDVNTLKEKQPLYWVNPQGEIVNILLKIKNSFLPTKQILIGL